MKKLLLSAMLAFSFAGISQTTIFSEDFETGGASFTLNTADLGAATVSNTWLINNSYTGGSGSFICLGFPFSFVVNNTAAQPGGITNSPNSTYMHISSQTGISQGITCASFIASDGVCNFDESNFSRMASPISTTGMSNVTLDFWWLCGGGATISGELYYSLDNGATWTPKVLNYWNQATWVQESLTDAAWDDQASLLFAFRFLNQQATAAVDPGFGVDDIVVTGTPTGGSTDITTGTAPLSSWCYGTTVTDVLDFTSTGTFNGPNVYTAEMSDAAGSFAAPTTIGTLTSSASGTLSINITVPGSMPAGTGYRMRVVASDPATTGTDNGADITIYPQPTVTLGTFSQVCDYTPFFTLTGGTPTGGTYSGTGVAAGSFDPSAAGVGTHTITYTYTDGNNCSNTATEDIVVDACLSLDELDGNAIALYPNPTNESFSIAANGAIDKVTVNDLNGRVVKSFDNGETTFNVSELNNGVYLVQVTQGTRVNTVRLVVQ